MTGPVVGWIALTRAVPRSASVTAWRCTALGCFTAVVTARGVSTRRCSRHPYAWL